MSGAPAASGVVVLALDTDWFSRHGGISTFNRKLCSALVATSATVYCAVRAPTPEEYADADKRDVRLIAGWGDTRFPPRLPSGVTPDVIIGHGRVTGPIAKTLATHHYPDAARLHILHTAPDEVARYKGGRDDDAGLRAEGQMDLELKLASDATRALAVGPRLHDLYRRELAALPGPPPEPLLIYPGFDRTGDGLRRTPPPGFPRQVLFTGRLDDPELKGLDIAVGAFHKALQWLSAGENEYELLLRGAPPTGHATLRRLAAELADLPVSPVTRSFSVDEGHLHTDLLRATVLLLPSRAEAFGLAAAEAITAGTPVLITERSGLGAMLRTMLPPEESRRLVLPVSGSIDAVTDTWARALLRVISDPGAAFTHAATIRTLLAERQTWYMAAEVVLAALRRPPETQPGTPTPPPTPLPTVPAAPDSKKVPSLTWQRLKRRICRSLHDDWRDLADEAGIDPADRARFQAGWQAQAVWEWLESRGQLPNLPDLLRRIERPELAELLDEAAEAHTASQSVPGNPATTAAVTGAEQELATMAWDELVDALRTTAFNTDDWTMFTASTGRLRTTLSRPRPPHPIEPTRVAQLVQSLTEALQAGCSPSVSADSLHLIGQQAESLRTWLLAVLNRS